MFIINDNDDDDDDDDDDNNGLILPRAKYAEIQTQLRAF